MLEIPESKLSERLSDQQLHGIVHSFVVVLNDEGHLLCCGPPNRIVTWRKL
jgi:hypothetical protein